MTAELQAFLALAEAYHQKHLRADSIDPFAYDPGNTENLAQYDGIVDVSKNSVTLCAEVKGLRYENRSRHLEKVSEGDVLVLRRDADNPYNANNFELFTVKGKTLGTLSAELCNCLAPLFDSGQAVISAVKASYIEQFRDRSRYVKQGVLFVQMRIVLHGTDVLK